MKDKELRKLIGSRAKQRRTELNLTQPYIAEKMGVTASTIQRYEAGAIDNTKKMVLEGLSEALHVSVEWLRGETDEYETDITDKRELQIRDAMTDILKQLPLDLTKTEDAFSKNEWRKPSNRPHPFRSPNRNHDRHVGICGIQRPHPISS